MKNWRGGDCPPAGCPLPDAVRSRASSTALLELAGRCFEAIGETIQAAVEAIRAYGGQRGATMDDPEAPRACERA